MFHPLTTRKALAALAMSAALLGACSSDTSDDDASTASASPDTASTSSTGEAAAQTTTADPTVPNAAGDDVDNPQSDPAPPDLGFLDEDVQQMVEFEAIWQCDLARYAVGDLSDIDALLAERRAQFGVTNEIYIQFQQQLSIDADLRQAVADQTRSCIDSGESVEL